MDDTMQELTMTDRQNVINVQSHAAEIRGQIINIFTHVEAIIDDIIRKYTFDTEAKYDYYMEALQKGDLPMNVKKKLLKMCIDKFEKIHSQDLSTLKEQIDNVVDKRNILAHWIADTSADGIHLYLTKKKIRFKSLDKNRDAVIAHFDFKSTNKLEKDTYRVLDELTVMQRLIYADIGVPY